MLKTVNAFADSVFNSCIGATIIPVQYISYKLLIDNSIPLFISKPVLVAATTFGIGCSRMQPETNEKNLSTKTTKILGSILGASLGAVAPTWSVLNSYSCIETQALIEALAITTIVSLGINACILLTQLRQDRIKAKLD